MQKHVSRYRGTNGKTFASRDQLHVRETARFLLTRKEQCNLRKDAKLFWKIALRSCGSNFSGAVGSSSSCGKPLPRSNFYVVLLEWTGTIEPDPDGASVLPFRFGKFRSVAIEIAIEHRWKEIYPLMFFHARFNILPLRASVRTECISTYFNENRRLVYTSILCFK